MWYLIVSIPDLCTITYYWVFIAKYFTDCRIDVIYDVVQKFYDIEVVGVDLVIFNHAFLNICLNGRSLLKYQKISRHL